ncbi:MAG: DUF4080 domain-containing protein [Selenomonadales bacterium]|nr:DUF4080 domain-containing protein [Selenomonadales bacterium]
MRVVLLALNASYVHTSLSARYLAAVCQVAGVKLHVVESNINEGAELITSKVMGLCPELLLCSVYIWNRRLMEDICTRIRLSDPGITIVWGGPEASGGWEDVLRRDDVDYVACGEGEGSVLPLIRALAQGTRPNTAGIAWRGGPLPKAPRLETLDKLPYPYVDEGWLQNKIYYFESSRGCPYNCAYCLSSREAGVRYMSLDTAKARLSHMMGKAPLIKFVDRTFNADPNRARALWEFLLSADEETRFHFEVCAHLLTADDFELLADPRAKRFQFEVGLQSASPPSLQAVNRQVDASHTLQAVRQLVQLGTVEVHLDLIAGLPAESLETFAAAVDAALATLSHRLHLGFLKLLPGTELRQKAAQLGLAYLPFAPYEVLRTPHMTAHDFTYLKALAKALDHFYNSRQAENALRYVLAQGEMTGFKLLGLLSAAEREAVQESVYLALEKYVPCSLTLKELCRLDFLCNEPHKRVPDLLLGCEPPEDEMVRHIVYHEPERLFAALPHRRGEKPGSILRQLRFGKFAHGELLFDHSRPRGERVFEV